MRVYEVAGHKFGVEIESPFSFMQYTDVVKERIEKAARGEVMDAIPIRAGDEVPSRSYVRSKSELPENFKGMLDLSQYEPFFIGENISDSLVFTLTVKSPLTEEREKEILEGSEMVLKVDEDLPWYYIRNNGGKTSYEFFPAPNKSVGFLVLDESCTRGEFIPRPGMGSFSVMGMVNTALMIMYTYNTTRLDTLLLHASVIDYEGKANLFFGTSGTGKSTHARLWLENIPGAKLVNDDNPIVRLVDGQFYVYGTPWSGKTPCYRNVRVPVGALVRLEQAPKNVIRRISGLEAYANILASSSCIRWRRGDMDGLVAMCEKVAMGVPNYHLCCLPDADAAKTSFEGTRKSYETNF